MVAIVGMQTLARKTWAIVGDCLGYCLDRMGCWSLVWTPAFGRAYADFLSFGEPRLGLYPGWTFGVEYFDERRWLTCRRGALWKYAQTHDLIVPIRAAWYDETLFDMTLGNDSSLCLYVCGSFEPNEFTFLSRIVVPGMVFIDVGANEGFYTLFASRRVGSTGQVVAVEPSSRERKALHQNIDLNRLDNVVVVPAALGATNCFAQLQIAPKTHSGHNTLGSFAHEGVFAVGSEEVRVETLDAVVLRLGLPRVDFVKVDVEGAEVKFIAGARNVLTTSRPVLLLEVNENALCGQGASSEALFATLQSDFDYEVLVFSQMTGEIERKRIGDALSANVVAVPRERVVEILDKQSSRLFGSAAALDSRAST